MKRKWKVLVITAVIALLLLSILLPSVYLFIRYDKPETTVVSLRVLEIDENAREFKLGLTIQIFNPNNLKMKVTRVEGKVLIDKEEVAPIYNTTGTSVPAKGISEIELVILVDDPSLKVLTGDALTIEGRSYGKYLWVSGSTEFSESIDLPGSGNGIDNVPPVAVIDAPLTALVLEEVEFDGSNSLDTDGSIARYQWDLGDGRTAEGEIINHRYSTPGLYIVKLTVTDDDGDQDIARHEITVRIKL
ncbi:MAG: PKD domain-containing protein [Thermoplasmatota archaeon]